MFNQPIVDSIQSHFLAHVTNHEAGQREQRPWVSNGSEELMQAVTLAVRCVQLRVHNRMRGGLTQVTYPSLRCFNVRRIEYKLLCVWIVSGCSSHSLRVRTVTKFGKTQAAKILQNIYQTHSGLHFTKAQLQDQV
jgi:hypothetical protein